MTLRLMNIICHMNVRIDLCRPIWFTAYNISHLQPILLLYPDLGLAQASLRCSYLYYNSSCITDIMALRMCQMIHLSSFLHSFLSFFLHSSSFPFLLLSFHYFFLLYFCLVLLLFIIIGHILLKRNYYTIRKNLQNSFRGIHNK